VLGLLGFQSVLALLEFSFRGVEACFDAAQIVRALFKFPVAGLHFFLRGLHIGVVCRFLGFKGFLALCDLCLRLRELTFKLSELRLARLQRCSQRANLVRLLLKLIVLGRELLLALCKLALQHLPLRSESLERTNTRLKLTQESQQVIGCFGLVGLAVLTRHAMLQVQIEQ
jgi:hypothetical protein